MTELQTFLRAILDTPDLDGAGALADWLDEHGDPRGRLLRARWKKWQKDREVARLGDDAEGAAIAAPWLQMIADLKAAGATIEGSKVSARTNRRRDRVDRLFARYFYLRFQEEICLSPTVPQGTLRALNPS